MMLPTHDDVDDEDESMQPISEIDAEFSGSNFKADNVAKTECFDEDNEDPNGKNDMHSQVVHSFEMDGRCNSATGFTAAKRMVGSNAGKQRMWLTFLHTIGDRTMQVSLVGTFSVLIVLVLVLYARVESSNNNNGVIFGGSQTSLEGIRDLDPQWRVRPTGLHVVIIGDSVSHYQYLSLVYFLRTGRWFDPVYRKSHLTNVYSYQSIFHDDIYGEFFLQTTRLLQPYEICDCVYPKGTVDKYRSGGQRVVLNRYFIDLEHNTTVRFFHGTSHADMKAFVLNFCSVHVEYFEFGVQSVTKIECTHSHIGISRLFAAFGNEHSMQGRLNASNITTMQGKEHDGLLNDKHEFHPEEIVWSSNSWAQVVREHIASLTPKPQYVILNAGQYRSNFEQNATDEMDDLVHALQELGSIEQAFWRTTTYQRGGANIRDTTLATDHAMCEKLGGCLNVSWTHDLSKNLFWDEVHNFEPG